MGFPGESVVTNLPANAEDTGDVSSIPGSGRSPGEGNGNPLQYSCLENPMDRGTWWATSPRDHKELDTTQQLSTSTRERRLVNAGFFFLNKYKSCVHFNGCIHFLLYGCILILKNKSLN